MKHSALLFVAVVLAAPSLLWGAATSEESATAAATDTNEAPMLAALVAAGELPPVQERLPAEPFVMEPVGGGEIGEYGGTIRLGSIVTARSVEASGIAGMPWLIGYDTDMSTVIPILAKEFSISDDARTYTFTLRKGLKWSDGHPFTTEDIRFWYQEALMNEELIPAASRSANWTPGGAPFELEIVDDVTARFTFAVPYPVAPWYFSIWWAGGPVGQTTYLPKHYLVDYHPNYVDRAELESRAKAEGYDDWMKYFSSRIPPQIYSLRYEVGIPTMAAYNLTQKGETVFLLERNPYYWKVDTEGNQLPYIDRLQVTHVSNKEVLMTKIINGEFDYARYNLSMEDFPLLQENQERGNYEFIDEWHQAYVTAHAIRFNLTHNDPAVRQVFQDFRFRRAMSIAIDREEMRDLLFFGAGEPMQNHVAPKSSKFFDPNLAYLHTEYDPEEASRLLDEMNLAWDANRQWRLRPDGEPLTLVIMAQQARPHLPPAMELVTEYWREVGINVVPRPVDNSIWRQITSNNEFDVTMYPHTGVEPRILSNPGNFVPVGPWGHWGNLWSQWYRSDGERGEAPPPDIKRLFDLHETMTSDPDVTRRESAVREILASTAENLWSIGTLGLYPQLAIYNKNMVNVPREPITAVADTRHDSTANPETWFYRGGKAFR